MTINTANTAGTSTSGQISAEILTMAMIMFVFAGLIYIGWKLGKKSRRTIEKNRPLPLEFYYMYNIAQELNWNSLSEEDLMKTLTRYDETVAVNHKAVPLIRTIYQALGEQAPEGQKHLFDKDVRIRYNMSGDIAIGPIPMPLSNPKGMYIKLGTKQNIMKQKKKGKRN